MADVELLPLPELPRQVEGYNSDYWEAGQIEEYAADYARACVEANLAPLQAENERLRAEVELWRHKAAVHKYRRKRLAEALRPHIEDLERSAVVLGQYPAMAPTAAEMRKAAAELRAALHPTAAQAAEIEPLRAEVREAREFRDKMANAIGNDQLRRFIEKHGEPVPLTIRMQQAEARAERLAEALREAADDLEREIDARIVVAQLRAALAKEDRNG